MLERDKSTQPATRPRTVRARQNVARRSDAADNPPRGGSKNPKAIPRIQSGSSADARSISLLEQLRLDAAPEEAAPIQPDPVASEPFPDNIETPTPLTTVAPHKEPVDKAANVEREKLTDPTTLEPLKTTQEEMIQMPPRPTLPAATHASTPQLTPEQPATGPTWDSLTQIPFRTGGNDPLRAQMHIAGSDDRVIRVIDDLRTQLLRSMETESWNRIAITSPTTGCGSTFTAVNLALSISRIPEFRAILMDLNQRNPGVARMLNLDGQSEMQYFLTGEVPADEHILKYSDTLALGLNTERSPNPSELLHSRRTGAVLDKMINDLCPDIVLYDLPAMLDYDDMSAFLPQVDGVLLVADATCTLGKQIEECEHRLAGKTPLLGVILNQARHASKSQQAA